MTRAEMHGLLEIMIEDLADTDLTDTQKDNLLSRGQELLVQHLPVEALHEIEEDFFAQALSDNSDPAATDNMLDNSLDLSALTGAVAWGFQWGINGVRVPANGKWGSRITFRRFKENEQRTWNYTSEMPKYLIYKNYLQVLPTSIATVDLYVYDKPALISSSQDCQLNELYHTWVVELAAFYRFRANNKASRAKDHMDTVLGGIAELKTRLRSTDENDPIDDELGDEDHGLDSLRIRLTGP